MVADLFSLTKMIPGDTISTSCGPNKVQHFSAIAAQYFSGTKRRFAIEVMSS